MNFSARYIAPISPLKIPGILFIFVFQCVFFLSYTGVHPVTFSYLDPFVKISKIYGCFLWFSWIFSCKIKELLLILWCLLGLRLISVFMVQGSMSNMVGLWILVYAISAYLPVGSFIVWCLFIYIYIYIYKIWQTEIHIYSRYNLATGQWFCLWLVKTYAAETTQCI